MKRITRILAPQLAIAALMAACAGAPTTAGTPSAAAPTVPQTASAPSDCSRLAAEIARAEEARRTATQSEQEAWKAVIPFAVAARYASGRAAAAEADQRRADFAGQFNQQGCARHGN